MTALSRSLALLVLVATPNLAQAEPFQITSFLIARPLIGTSPGDATLVWSNPPRGVFETSTRKDLTLVAAVWTPDAFRSTLPGATTPVTALSPGAVPVGGTFNGGAANFLFDGNFPSQGVPLLESAIALEFSGGDFLVPSVFPPTDDEGLYLLTQPFSMRGRWTVWEDGTAIFDGELAGRGIASLSLFADRATGRSVISSVNYAVQDVAPVPEPATFFLVALGAAGLVARARVPAQSDS